MAIFSILFLLLNYLQLRGLEDTVTLLSAPTQKFCQNLLQAPSEHLQFYQAVACGIPIKNSSYDILKVVSLWHLVIVSAGHFSVILWITKKFWNGQSIFTSIILSLFTLMTGAQPPVVRAFADYLLKKYSLRAKLWAPPEFITLYSSSVLLILFPSWASSWSFLLSWLCGILIHILNKKSLFIQSLGMAIGVFPIICAFSTPHPLSFLFNWILGPPISIVLFPCSLLLIPFPFLHYVMDPLLNGLLLALNNLAGGFNPSPFLSTPPQSHLICCWIYLLILQWYIIRRKKYA